MSDEKNWQERYDQVVALVDKGYSNIQISEIMEISEISLRRIRGIHSRNLAREAERNQTFELLRDALSKIDPSARTHADDIAKELTAKIFDDILG